MGKHKHVKSNCNRIAFNFSSLSFHRSDGKVVKFGKNGQFVAGINDVLGQGSFGLVYRATDTETGRVVAVKTELNNRGIPTLPTEIANYALIGPNRKSTKKTLVFDSFHFCTYLMINYFFWTGGIPKIYYTGMSSDGESSVIVMQILENSLDKLQRNRIDKKFTPKTVFMIGIQLVSSRTKNFISKINLS